MLIFVFFWGGGGQLARNVITKCGCRYILVKFKGINVGDLRKVLSRPKK